MVAASTASTRLVKGHQARVRIPQWLMRDKGTRSTELVIEVNFVYPSGQAFKCSSRAVIRESDMCLTCGEYIRGDAYVQIGYCSVCAHDAAEGLGLPAAAIAMDIKDIKQMVIANTTVEAIVPFSMATVLNIFNTPTPEQPAPKPTSLPGTKAIEKPTKPLPPVKVYVRGGMMYAQTPHPHDDVNAKFKSIMGYSWSKETRAWMWKASPTIAMRFKNVFEGVENVDQTDAEFQALIHEAMTADAHEAIKVAEMDDLPQPEGFKSSLWLHQLRAFNYGMAKSGVLLSMAMGTGKASAVSAPVLTPTGWKRMGDIRLGDEIISSDGNTSRVIGVFPQGVKPIYRVTFSDGASTRVTADHLWLVNSASRKYKGLPPRTLTTKEIAGSLRDGAGNCKHYIPVIAPVNFPERELPIAPYLLGVLLGDGSMTTGTPSLSNPEPEIVAEVVRLLPSGVKLYPRPGREIDYYLSADREAASGGNTLTHALRSLGLFGCHSATKFIPDAYLFAPRQDREALLQGLLDTDATIDSRTGCIEFTTVSKQLMRGVVALVQSLGGIATVTTKAEPRYSYRGDMRTGQLAYRVSVVVPNEITPFRLPRKTNLVIKRTKYHPTRAIIAVEPDGEEEAQCIAVDAPDHLYVTDGYILTHNTLTTLAIAAGRRCKKILIICPRAVLDVWPDEVRKHVDYPMIVCAPTKKGLTVAKKVALMRAALEEGERTNTPVLIAINYESAIRPPFAPKYGTTSYIGRDGAEHTKTILVEEGFAREAHFDLAAIDECVVGGTMIATPYGDRPIEDIKVGDLVYGFDHERGHVVATPVLDTRMSESELPISTVGDTRMTCNHPVWTQGRGYTMAGLVDISDTVCYIDKETNHFPGVRYARFDMSGMRKLVSSSAANQQSRSSASVLQQGMRSASQHQTTWATRKNASWLDERTTQRTDEQTQTAGRRTGKATHTSSVGEQSGQESRQPSQGVHCFTRKGIRTSQWRQWEGTQQTAATTGSTIGMADRNHCQYGGWATTRHADLLQNRYSRSDTHDRNRSGRQQSFNQEGSTSGSAQDELLDFERLALAAFYELRRAEQSGRGSAADNESCTVYNIETATNNYFANGLLVHNCHRLGNPQSATSQFAGYLAETVRYREALSGTPLQHDPLNAWGVFRFVDPTVFDKSFAKFKKRYAKMGGWDGKEITGWLNLDELEQIIAKHSFTVGKDVLKLPPQVLSVRYGALSDEESRHYASMEHEFEVYISGGAADEQETISDEDGCESTDGPTTVGAQNVLARLMKLSQMSSGFIIDEEKVPHEIGSSKLDLLEDTLQDIDRDEPLVIFVRFTYDIARIRKRLAAKGYKVAELSGKRNELRAWQQGEYDTLVVQLQSGSEGVNFTWCGSKQCKYCIFFSKDYRWEKHEQALSRIHRPGQNETTFFISLIMRDTIDEEIEDVLEKRGDLLKAVIEQRTIKGLHYTQSDEVSDFGEDDEVDS